MSVYLRFKVEFSFVFHTLMNRWLWYYSDVLLLVGCYGFSSRETVGV